MDVIESEHLLSARLARAIMSAALHSSPQADFEKGAGKANESYIRALGSIPYLEDNTQDGSRGISRERQAAVDRWREIAGKNQQP